MTRFNYFYLIRINSLCSYVIPLTSIWKLAKDATNYIPINMICLTQTSRKILEDGDVIIFPVVLITPKALRPIV